MVSGTLSPIFITLVIYVTSYLKGEVDFVLHYRADWSAAGSTDEAVVS